VTTDGRAQIGASELKQSTSLPNEPMIVLSDVSKRYKDQGQPVVDHLSISVYRGEILILTGPSGCGKTTTLKMINRIVEPTSGSIFVDGVDVTSVKAATLRQRIGYVIQNVGLFPHMTIYKNIAEVPTLLGWNQKDINERVTEMLALVGLEPSLYRNRYPRELSGGQAQRVGVARALAGDPPVLLMDEPFAAVDPITRRALQDEFLRLQDRLKKTIVLVTHDMAEAMKLGDRVVVLGPRARIEQLGPPQEILAYPKNDFVRGMLGNGRLLQLLETIRLDDTVVPSNRPPQWGAGTLTSKTPTLPGSPSLVLDDGRPRSWRSSVALEDAPREAEVPVSCTVELSGATLMNILDAIIACPFGCAVVVDSTGHYITKLSFENVLEVVAKVRSSREGTQR